MRAFAITGMLTCCMISRIFPMGAMRATPPSLRISAGTRSRAMTAVAPAFSAITACSALVTSMITPPFSISARPVFKRNVSSRYMQALLNHCRSFGQGRICPHALQFILKNTAEHGDSGADLLRRHLGKTDAKTSGLRPRHREVLARKITNAFAFSTRQQLTGIQWLRQAHPEAHAAARVRKLNLAGQIFPAGLQHRMQSLAARREHPLAMALQAPGLREAQQNGLGKLISVQIAALLGFRELLDQRARPDGPAHAQSRKRDFRETAQQDGISRLIQLLDARQSLAFVRQSAVDIVFHQDDAGCLHDS